MQPLPIAVDLTPSSILLIRFSGTYPDGSPGNSVAEWMAETAARHVRERRPRGLVLDLRELRYEWGDMIEILYGLGARAEPPIPQATVVSDTNRRAFSTLEWGLDTDRDITELDDVFDSPEEAISFVERAAAELP